MWVPSHSGRYHLGKNRVGAVLATILVVVVLLYGDVMTQVRRMRRGVENNHDKSNPKGPWLSVRKEHPSNHHNNDNLPKDDPRRVVVLMLSNRELPWNALEQVLQKRLQQQQSVNNNNNNNDNNKTGTTSSTRSSIVSLTSQDLDQVMADSQASYGALAILANFAWCQRHGYSFRYVRYPSFDEVPPPIPFVSSKNKGEQQQVPQQRTVDYKKNTKRGMVGLWHAAERTSENPYRRYPTYWKSYEIVQLLQNDDNNDITDTDWVVHLDTDAIVSNHQLTYRQVLRLDDDTWNSTPNQLDINEKWWKKKPHFARRARQEPYMVFGKDVEGWPGVCAGVFAVRNSATVRQKMCEWWWMPPTGKTDDQSQLNSMLLNGYRDHENDSFWQDHASVLPAEYLYHGKTVFHGAAGNGCDIHGTSKVECLRQQIAANNLTIQLSTEILSRLRGAVVQRQHNHNCVAHTCRARSFRYPRQIRPSEHCRRPLGGGSSNRSNSSNNKNFKSRHAIVAMLAEPTPGTELQSFAEQLDATMGVLQSLAERFQNQSTTDVVFVYPDISTWTNTALRKTFSRKFGIRGWWSKLHKTVVSTCLNSAVKQIEASIVPQLKQQINNPGGSGSSNDDSRRRPWYAYHKLALWTLEDYDRILFLGDSNNIALPSTTKDWAEIFECSTHGYEFLSVTDTLMALNGDFFWLKPSKKAFKDMLSYLKAGQYSDTKGWYDTGLAFAEHLDIPSTERVFEVTGTVKSKVFDQVKTSLQGFLFWYFYAHKMGRNSAQLDKCVVNNGATSGPPTLEQCRHECMQT
mmetsp:Transcript_28986/g.67800  ORF Transcript_28986/g.67800 Transcript_28986/m.67800 type:complete len:799 (+) Transcript_28986:115-2511(+)